MTITQLGTFLKIAETGNFTTAANLLGYAQSTVTTQIKQLEAELNCLLFEPGTCRRDQAGSVRKPVL